MKGVVAMVFATGCSFVGVTRPPSPLPPHRDKVVECTSSPAAPIADTLGAVVFGVATFGMVGLASESESPGGPIVLGIGGALLATVFLVSAIRGYEIVADCDAANHRD